jgi:small nuclear ribonucleoprotein (snRNP)-like protein
LGENSLNSREKGSVVERLRGYLDSMVEVHLLDEQIIRGRLVQIDEDLVNIFIEDCIDLAGRTSRPRWSWAARSRT